MPDGKIVFNKDNLYYNINSIISTSGKIMSGVYTLTQNYICDIHIENQYNLMVIVQYMSSTITTEWGTTVYSVIPFHYHIPDSIVFQFMISGNYILYIANVSYNNNILHFEFPAYDKQSPHQGNRLYYFCLA